MTGRLPLQTATGETVTVQVPLVLGGERTSVIQGLHIPPTMARSRAGYYWHQYLADSRTFYIQYNVCENDPKQPFSAFVHEALKDADAHTVKRVVIDLRNNGGGNEHVIGPLKAVLAERAGKLGPVYVLIGPVTFSSAVDNAATLRKELSAKFVGEPSGGLAGGYGEVSLVKLPNSKLQVQFTTKGSFPKDGEPLNLIPDISATLNLADLLAGHDPALEAPLHAN